MININNLAIKVIAIAMQTAIREIEINLRLLRGILGRIFSASSDGFKETEMGIPLFNIEPLRIEII